jgi:hypothetical protein
LFRGDEKWPKDEDLPDFDPKMDGAVTYGHLHAEGIIVK